MVRMAASAIHVAGDDALQLDGQLGGGDHHVVRQVGHGRVAAPSDQVDVQFGGVGEQDSRFDGDGSHGVFRGDVEGQHHVRPPGVEDFALQKGLGPSGPFFRRLEDEEQVVVDGMMDEVGEDPQGDGHVEIVAAGVHPARMGGAKGEGGLLFHGQRVHVRPVPDAAGGIVPRNVDETPVFQVWISIRSPGSVAR